MLDRKGQRCARVQLCAKDLASDTRHPETASLSLAFCPIHRKTFCQHTSPSSPASLRLISVPAANPQSVPGLAGKAGARVVSELDVERVGQLATWPRRELVSRFGAQLGAFLADLPWGAAERPGSAGGRAGGEGGGGGAVRDRGLQKSILVEKR